MAWWDNLWLNEAFATLMGELVIPDRIWPEWKVRQEFVGGHLVSALGLDSQRSSHPIEVDCPDANQINQIFDSISYSKGASVLRMLSSVVGEETFLKGVSLYLKKHLYSNAVTADLWAGISEASGMDVSKVMANWTLKVGFPVISVEEPGDGTIKVTQNRFLSTGDVKPEEDETLWWVPLQVKTVGSDGKVNTDPKAFLEGRSTTYDLKGSDAFKLNGDSIGVYRVKYTPERLAKLGQQAQSFSVEDRVGLIGDAATIARAGYAKTSGSLNLINELAETEKKYLPLDQINLALGKLTATWWEQPKEVRDAINALRIKVFKPVVERLGYDHKENDAPDVKELRTLAISTCAGAEDADVLAELKARFQPFLEKNDDSRIPPDLQRITYSVAVKHGGETEYNKIRAVYDKPPTPHTKVDALFALGVPKDQKLIDRTFAMFTDGSLKSQDYYIAFFALASNRESRRQIGDYFMKNFDRVSASRRSDLSAVSPSPHHPIVPSSRSRAIPRRSAAQKRRSPWISDSITNPPRSMLTIASSTRSSRPRSASRISSRVPSARSRPRRTWPRSRSSSTAGVSFFLTQTMAVRRH